MKYAVTFTTNKDDWESVNTLVIEANNVAKATDVIVKALIHYGYDVEEASYIYHHQLYYIRSCDDVDYKVKE